MRSPLEHGTWIELDEVASTQDVAAELLKSGERPGVVFARHQTQGRGRFGRVWSSERGCSLTASLVFESRARPWLFGMAVALASAKAFRCFVQWPNDIVSDGKKVGGILTETVRVENGSEFAVVGVGVNLGGFSVPVDLGDKATAAEAYADPLEAIGAVLNELALLPEALQWADIEDEWRLLDQTPGKIYRLQSGESVFALRVGEDGSLMADSGGKTIQVLAADALFGCHE